jgi:hypothetical protein
MTDLTPAVRAAVDAMGALCVPPGDIEEIAPDVVAAVRGPLLADPKERLHLAHELAKGSFFTVAEAVQAVESLLNANNKRRIQADALVEAADALRASERLRSFTDDHMGDVNEAADELDRMAAALLQPSASAIGETA